MGIFSIIRRVVRDLDQLANNSDRSVHLLQEIVQGIANQADLQNRHLVAIKELVDANNRLLEANSKLLLEASIVLRRDGSDAIDELTQAVDELRSTIGESRAVSEHGGQAGDN